MTGLSDYWRMFKARGAGRVWHHFKDVTLFDLIHDTDTDTWLPISSYQRNLDNLESAIWYQPSFTSEIRKSLDFVCGHLAGKAAKYDFYDLGSGKGKVCFIAKNYPFHSINGIEFYQPLHEIALRNAKEFKDKRLNFHCVDVTEFDFTAPCLVFFAYNPFDLTIWNKLLKNIADKKYVVIYNNPVHAEIYEDRFIWYADTDSKWENKRTVIFSSFAKPN